VAAARSSRERIFQPFEGSFGGRRQHPEVLGIYFGGRRLRAENGLLQIRRVEAIKI
jgi:hypothetical protein